MKVGCSAVKLQNSGGGKEKRDDAKIIVLAVFVNREGFLKYSNIFEGNICDCKTLETMIDTLSRRTSRTARKPIVVMDAGIAAGDNIAMLKNREYDYMCVSQSNLKAFYADNTNMSPLIEKNP